MIPDVMRYGIIEETNIHYGHLSAYKTYHALPHKYQLRNMYNAIKKFTRACDLCQRSKIDNRTARGPTISTITEAPRHTISVDLMGPLPSGQLEMRYILAMLDTFSKHIKLYALRRATTDIILKKITEDYLPQYGPIHRILTDNDNSVN